MNSPRVFIESLEDRLLLAAFEAHINFQPARVPTPAGYVKDVGAAFGKQGRLSFGWNGASGATAVDRNAKLSKDQRHDTFNLLQAGMKSRKWEIAVPNGAYRVAIVAGDAGDVGNVYRIRAEKTLVVDGKSAGKKRWVRGEAIVRVTDGKLTLTSAKGAVRNKIAFIDIKQLRAATTTIEAESFDQSSGVVSSGGLVSSLNDGDYLRFNDVNFTAGIRSVRLRLSLSAANAGQEIELRLDSATGPLLGTLTTEGAGAGAVPRTQSIAVTPGAGVRNLFVVFKGPDVGAIDWLGFSTRPLVKIMPLGDSITEARGGYASYRRHLWNLLDAEGHSVDFIGTRSGVRPGSGDPPFFDYDQDHEGRSGFRVDTIRDNIAAWIAQGEAPDVVLLQAGINDLLAGQSPPQAVAELGEIIDRLRIANPNVTVLVGNLTPTTLVNDASIREFNSSVMTLAGQKNTSQSRIVAVDHYAGFSAADDTFDGLHPNAQGEVKLAGKWHAALQGIL